MVHTNLALYNQIHQLQFLQWILEQYFKKCQHDTYKNDSTYTMLQKLSKCEVKAWLCWNLMILLPLRFCVKSNFGEFKQSKNVIFGNSRDSEVWILVNFGLESCSNWLKSKFSTSKIAKNDIFGLFEFAKMWFHVKSKWR